MLKLVYFTCSKTFGLHLLHLTGAVHVVRRQLDMAWKEALFVQMV